MADLPTRRGGDADAPIDTGLPAALLAAGIATVRGDEPLAPRTTLKVGGPAAALVVAETAADVAATAAVCAVRQVPWLVVGRGSNLLVADTGFPGVAVTLGRGFRGVEVDGTDVVAGAAEPMPVLARAVARHALGGLAFGVAIPGSLGGAVRMNAGAMGAETRDVLVSVEVARLADGGRIERLPVASLQLSYRHSALPPDALVVRARLRLTAIEPAELDQTMRRFKQWRREHQPVNEPSCGSVFRNPPGDSAGRLIEAAGLKGHRVGGAQVSLRHANFITAAPSATAADVARVIADVRTGVMAHAGVELATEVVLAGFGEDLP